MWFKNNKQQLEALQAQLEASEAQVARLETENRQLREQLAMQAQPEAGDEFEQALCGAWVKGGELIRATRESLASNASALLAERTSLAESASIFEQTRGSVEQILQRVEHIRQHAGQSHQQLSRLAEESGAIERFVAVIADISDQTNLLALNAAIEAARAGESGRGFAVVADEVRNLARKAQQASKEIAQLVGRIVVSTEETGQDIGAVNDASTEVVASAEQIRAGVAQVVSLSDRMHQVINNSAAAAFFETVKLDHVAWKNHIYQCIISGSLDKAQGVADHTACRLGQWYYTGEGAERYAGLSSYDRLEAPHEQVHRAGLAALEAARQGQQAQVLQQLRQMEEASMAVARAIDAMRDEALAQQI